MGIVRRQSIGSSLFIYLGFAVGAFNILYLFREYLSLEQAGLIFFIVAISKVIQGFVQFGNTATMNKFFPYYKDYLPDHRNDFLKTSFILPVVGSVLFIIFWILLKDVVIQETQKKSPLFSQYYYWMIPASLFLVFYTTLETYSATRYRVLEPTFLREIVLRVLTTLLVVGFYFGWWGFDTFIYSYSLLYLVLLVLLIGILYRSKQLIWNWRTSSVTHRLKGKMMSYGGFVYGGILISALAENADTFIIGTVTGLSNVAVFQTGNYIATIIQVPYRSLSAIVAPLLAQAWKDKDMPKILDLYKRTSTNQLILAGFIFGAIWLNIDYICSVLGNDFSEVRSVIFLLGISRVLDLGFGQNSEILNNSRYWRFNFFSYVILVMLFMPLNYILVKQMGIAGSAWSNLLSYLVFNLVRFVFLWYKCRLQPFGMNTLWVILTLGACYFITRQTGIWIGFDGPLSLIINSLLFSLLFLLCVVRFHLSEDMIHLGRQVLGRLGIGRPGQG